MKAVLIRAHGDLEALSLEELPDPQAGAGQVRIRVQAIGLNHLDTWVRRGVPGHSFPLPMIPGCDFCGVIDQVGAGVAGLKNGDKVLVAPGFSCGRCEACARGDDNLCRGYGIFGETTNGGCAELAVVPAVNAIPLPPNMEWTTAAAFPLAYLTAWHMLVARCRVQPGDDVLVHAAGSGVGSAAVQIAKLFRARVIATAGSDRKLEQARALGADHAINYETRDWVAEVKQLTGRRGVDIVVEHTGEKTFGGSLKSLAKGGRVVTCGATSGSKLEADLKLIFFKSLSILGSTMGSRGELLRIVELVAQGQLRPVVDRVLPLSQIREAHAAMGRREQFGKIVLVPDAASGRSTP